MKALIANIHSVDRPYELTKLIDVHRPHFVAVSEAMGAGKFLFKELGDKYWISQGDPRWGTDWDDVRLLIRSDLTILNSGYQHNNSTWTGPIHGLRHDPKHFPRAKVEGPNGQKLRLLGVHNPYPLRSFGANITRPMAYPPCREALNRQRDWLHNSDIPSLAMGDFNTAHLALHNILDVKVKSGGSRVDHFAFHGLKNTEVERFRPPRTGMHGWMMLHFNL